MTNPAEFIEVEQEVCVETTEAELKSLVVADPSEAGKLRDLISQVVVDHEVHSYRHEETFEACNNHVYQLIWLRMTLPASQEVLSLSTSIRYASKSNRGTVILGLSDNQPDVDLRLHGIDEVLVGPLNKAIVRQKYIKWTHVQTLEGEDTNLMLTECPKTPTTPSSVGSDTMSSNLNSSQDLGLSGTPEERSRTPQSSASGELAVTTNSTPTTNPGSPGTNTVLASLRDFNLQSVNYQPRPARTSMATAADHTTKEKLRRERIKDSCDQLRVLLPYIRGRKTDMASILEMTVDYLKIVNAAIPQDFQNQVINLMSKGAVLPKIKDGSRCRRSGRREQEAPESPSAARVSSTVDAGARENMTSPGLCDLGMSGMQGSMSTSARSSPGPMTMAGTKRESNEPYQDMKTNSNSKRMHLSPHSIATTAPTPPTQGLVYIQSDGESRSHIYGELEASGGRRYANTFLPPETYPTSVAGATRISNIDRDTYGMYVENYYQYYAGQQPGAGSYGTTTLSDYVNPNAVLPVAYSTRMVEQDRFGVPGSDNMQCLL